MFVNLGCTDPRKLCTETHFLGLLLLTPLRTPPTHPCMYPGYLPLCGALKSKFAPTSEQMEKGALKYRCLLVRELRPLISQTPSDAFLTPYLNAK